VPTWARRLPVPIGTASVKEALNGARLSPSALFEPEFAPLREELAAQATAAAKVGAWGHILDVLDLAPNFLLKAQEHPWAWETIRQLFVQRNYFAFTPLQKRVRKVASGVDSLRAFLVDHFTRLDDDLPAGSPPSGMRMLPTDPQPKTATTAQAMSRLAKAQGVPVRTVARSLDRFRQTRSVAPAARTKASKRGTRKGPKGGVKSPTQ
jgi:hypothetical protein